MPCSWLVLVGSAAAQDVDGASPVTETELGWIARELAPVVEQVAGRRFERIPELVLADPDRIAQVVYEEQRHLLRGAEGIDDPHADDAARRTAAEVSSAFAGKYGFLDGRLYVSVEGIADSLALEGQPAWLLRPMIRVVVAHELTHALQDQYVDFESQVRAAPNGDAIMALNCAVEGHAVWVHERVGEIEGLGEAVRVMADLLGSEEPVRRRMDPDAFYHRYVYGLGRDFVAQHARAGGTDQVWRVLEHPPVATSMIVAPDTWSDAVGAVEPLSPGLMRRASRHLGRRDWQLVGSVMGDFDVRDQLVRAGADSGLADDLDTGWNSRLVGGAMAGVEVQVLRFKHEDAARAFVEDMLTQAEVQAELVGADPFISADAGSFDRVEADRSGRERFTVSLLGPPDQLGRIWVARGSDVVQIVLVNAPATDREIAATIDRVFRGLGR